jgi:hypothetical protein
MRAKLGRARPISETELSFLGTFHLRFRKAAQDAKEESFESVSAPEEPTEEAVAASTPARDEAGAPEPETEPEAAAAEAEPLVERGSEPPAAGRPRRAVQTDVGKSATSSTAETGSEARSAASSSAEDDIPTNVLHEEVEAEEAIADEAPSRPSGPDNGISKIIGPKRLQEALSTNDHQTVLRELYREVTAIAEGVWSSEVTPAPLVWEQVTSSDWYERNFSRLGLQPLSVFYEVTAKVDKKVRAGAERKELQEFLKETNFAKTLLSLRDMFQANNI